MSSHHADSLEDRDYSVIPATDGNNFFFYFL